MARRTTSAAKSPSVRSAAAPAAMSGAIAATPSSDLPRLAPSSASHSGTTSDHGSKCQTKTLFHTSHKSSATAAPAADRHQFCPSYENDGPEDEECQPKL